MKTINISTSQKEDLIDLTTQIEQIVSESAVKDGICILYSPHTTAGITINENADPDVKSDVLIGLNNISKNLTFKHMEGNSPAHIKTILVGKSQTIIIENNQLQLGTWDGIWFCEFDGPRERSLYIQILEK